MSRLVVVVAVLALFFVACGGEGSPEKSAEGTPEGTTESTTGGTTESTPPKNVPAATPEDSLKALQRAFVAKDWTAVIDFMPPSSVALQEAKHIENLNGPVGEMMADRLELELEAAKAMSFKEYTAAVFGQSMEMSPKMIDSIVNSTIIDTQIEEDRATIKMNTGEKEQDARFQQEDGLWYWSSLAGRIR